MWEYILAWMSKQDSVGMRLIDYSDMLFPQYEHKFQKTISRSTWNRIQERAKELLNDETKKNSSGCREALEKSVRRDGSIRIHGGGGLTMEVLRNGTRVIGIFKCPVCLCEFSVHIKECRLSPACVGSRLATCNCPTCNAELSKSVTDFKEDGND